MGTRLIGDVALSHLGDVKTRKDLGGVDVVGIPTGFWQVDEFIGGLRADTVGVIAGRPGMGKSALALDIALNVAKQNKRVVLYSLEMTAERLTNRLLSRLTDIPSGKIIRGRLTDDEFQRVRRAAEELGDTPLALCDDTHDSLTITDHIKNLAERALQSDGPNLELMIIDYASLLRDRLAINENERLGRISNNIRALARPDQLNIPILLLAQLNREVEKRENHMPQLSDIRDSGSIEQDAEWVAMVHRPHYYAMQQGSAPLPVEQDGAIILAKNREGPTGLTRAEFYPAKTMWKQNKPVPLSPKPIEKGLTKRG